MLILAMSACDFNPTDWGTGGGGTGSGDGGDKDDKGGRTELVKTRGAEGDVVTTPCDGVFMVSSINVDDSGNTVVVVTYRTEDGEMTVRLNKENPSFKLGDCIIHFKGVTRVASSTSDEPILVANFMIKKAGDERKNDDRRKKGDRDDDSEDEGEDDDEDDSEEEEDDDEGDDDEDDSDEDDDDDDNDRD